MRSGVHQKLEVLTFRLGSQRYGIRADETEAVARMVALTDLPASNPLIEGVIDYHGQLVPVLDIRRRFNLDRAPVEAEHHLILGRTAGMLVALRVDSAEDLVQMESSELEQLEYPADVDRAVAGIARTGEGLLVIHDLAAFLSSEQAGAIKESLNALGANREEPA